ncbi:hypothetical protein [Klenkia sp. PcliD-1-E]|uniref:hypothetical protein n=1 Tax=Klenkia sp. PcliD-1-E TaxID=2954492 RepID=UPI0020968169|nr:hypothetical protein [Klenkia sp. PcliD-1-E]MCO7221535.1 hypothetical protein [Klenkia sp. PcliD-1-E]
MNREGFTRELRGTVFNALTGRGGDVSGRPDGDVRGMLLAIGGPAKTKSGINLTAAAAALGVSRRTAERWVTNASQKSRLRGANLAKVVAQSRQAATTKAGRRRAMAAARRGSLTRRGAKLSITGKQGPTRAGTDYRRRRRIDLMLGPGDVEEMMAAYEQGGDQGYMSWVEAYAGENYLDDWGVDSLDKLEVSDPREDGL